MPSGPLDRCAADVTVERFHAAHQRTYGYSYGEQPEQRIEWVNFRLVGIGPLRRPDIRKRPRCHSGGPERARSGGRRVFFEDRFVDTPLYDRTRLQPGDAVEGPAIVEEFGSTTVVFPTQQVRVDDYGNLLLTRLG